jgi:hypothetical protein
MVIRECDPPEVVIGSVGRITAEDLKLTLIASWRIDPASAKCCSSPEGFPSV